MDNPTYNPTAAAAGVNASGLLFGPCLDALCSVIPQARSTLPATVAVPNCVMLCCAVPPPPRPVSCQVVIIPIPNSKASPELVEAMIEQVGFFCFGWAGGIVFGGGWMPALVFSWL